ncbi:MAG TPA: amidohydrolase family protein [Candidatus Omnitrophota bacterium]|nr:amidohydrolase family protein [Candidatus Omnitrophota bacterium]
MAGIIDFHSHYIPPEIAAHTAFFKVNWSNVDKHLESMDALGIEKAVLFYPTTDAHMNLGGWDQVCRVYNQKISDLVKNHPDRFIGAGIISIENPYTIVGQLKNVQNLGLSIISLASSYNGHYLDEEVFFPLYEFVGKHHMPVHVHPQIIHPIGEERVKDPLLTPVLEYVFDVSMCIGKMMMADVFHRFSDVRFIFAHYGGVLPFVKERFDNTYQMLRGRDLVKDLGAAPSTFFKNLYFDTSGSQSPAALQCALEVVDAEHILFGSDFPANQKIPAAIEVIEKSGLSAQERDAILFANAQKLILAK